jgi:hypothetical protein
MGGGLRPPIWPILTAYTMSFDFQCGVAFSPFGGDTMRGRFHGRIYRNNCTFGRVMAVLVQIW